MWARFCGKAPKTGPEKRTRSVSRNFRIHGPAQVNLAALKSGGMPLGSPCRRLSAAIFWLRQKDFLYKFHAAAFSA
jgi:hypothetical protein